MNNKLKLSHTILYAKGWYEWSDDIIKDLTKTLEADGYSVFTPWDIRNILLSTIDKLDNTITC